MSASVSQSKAVLRAKVRKALAERSAADKTIASLKICSRFRQQTIWEHSQSILFYAALSDEPDIWPLVGEALAAGKLVCLPRFVPEQNGFIACQIENPNRDVQPGHFGVREPNADCPAVPLNRLDLILVPGVGFDLNGRRLGRGKGFYDRWLANHSGTVCGVAFDQQIVGEVPIEPHDIRLSCILTPTRWQKTGGRRAVLE